MNEFIHQDVARTHLSARLDEAQSLRRGRNVVLAGRLARRAERAERQARLAAARI